MNIEQKVAETIKKYKLLKKSDRVVVALSGGKDSTSVLYILKKMGYNIEGLMIDLYLGKWSKIHKKNMIRFCGEIDVLLTIVDLKEELGQGICFIKAVLKKQKNLTGCAVCGTIKKWILNKWAKKMGADKLVTGHNLDDEAQNVLMNFLKGNILLGVNSGPATGGVATRDSELPSQIQNKYPHKYKGKSSWGRPNWLGQTLGSGRLGTAKKKGGFVQRVKPLFFVPESEIMKYAKLKKFDILYDKCPCAFGTYRVDTRDWMSNISDGEKMKIVENFQKLVPKLRSENIREIKKCKKCGEPSSGEICGACKIFSCLK